MAPPTVRQSLLQGGCGRIADFRGRPADHVFYTGTCDGGARSLTCLRRSPGQGTGAATCWKRTAACTGCVAVIFRIAALTGGNSMRTALDMAKRLKQKSLTQVAIEVALLNHVALPKPLSLLAVMKLFAKVAVPEPPKNLVNEFKFPTESPTLSPIFSDVTWVDAGAKTFRHATRYRCRIALIYDGDDTAVLNENDSWTNSTEIVFHTDL